MSAPNAAPEGRRPLKSRQVRFFQQLAGGLSAKGISANAISLASIGFALLAALFFWLSTVWGWPGLLLGAIAVQLRLLCNLLDGLVAIECGKKSPVGGFYNEAPDRLADLLILIGFGAVGGAWLAGCAATIGALATAYVRSLGAELGAGHWFQGPMAKPHRMAAITAAALILIALPMAWWGQFVAGVLWVVTAGCAITVIRRTAAILKTLREKAACTL